METIILDASDDKNIEICVGVMKSGGVIAFPTETVYGLGAGALNTQSVAKIFDVKGRPADNPIIVHVASADDVKQLVYDVPDVFERLVNRFWPGPLTLIMKKTDSVPYNVTAGLETVAVRMPEHPVALSLIKAFGSPIAAPSANPSGKPSPTKARHVMNDLAGKIPFILDGGDCKMGIESTVLDISAGTPKILRPGSITYEELKDILGSVENNITSGTSDIINDDKPKSPGMKYRHYAPKALLTAVCGSPDKTAQYITARVNDETAGLMFDDYAAEHLNVITYGHSKNYSAQASNLFEAIRKTDELKVSLVYVQVPNENGLGFAIADRIKKAAGDNIIEIV